MEPTFSFACTRGSDHQLINLSGTIDAQAEPHFEELQKQISSALVIFDFSKVGRVNSMGIALLLRCFKRLGSERSINVQLQGLSQMNTMLFKMSGLFLLAKEVR